MTVLLIGVGGFLGAIARYLVDGFVNDRTGATTFPWGIFVVNLSGSFALGVIYAVATERAILSPEVRAPLMIGFIGAYSTFSTWLLQSLRLAETGELPTALANVGGSVILGIAAVGMGLVLGRAAL